MATLISRFIFVDLERLSLIPFWRLQLVLYTKHLKYVAQRCCETTCTKKLQIIFKALRNPREELNISQETWNQEVLHKHFLDCLRGALDGHFVKCLRKWIDEINFRHLQIGCPFSAKTDTGNVIAVTSCERLYVTGARIGLTIFTIGSLTSIDCSAVWHPSADGTPPLLCTVIL